ASSSSGAASTQTGSRSAANTSHGNRPTVNDLLHQTSFIQIEVMAVDAGNAGVSHHLHDGEQDYGTNADRSDFVLLFAGSSSMRCSTTSIPRSSGNDVLR